MRLGVLRILCHVVCRGLQHGQIVRITPRVWREFILNALGELRCNSGSSAGYDLLYPYHLRMSEYLDHFLADASGKCHRDIGAHRWTEIGVQEDAIRTEVAHDPVMFAI